MITADPRPMSSAPLDGTPVRLFASLGSAIASFWTAERSRKAFGAGDYRAGWFLLDDEAVELNNPMGWEPPTKLIAEKARDFGEARRHRDLRRAAWLHATALELRQPVVALNLGGLRRRIEALMVPDEPIVVLQLDGLAERERHRRQA